MNATSSKHKRQVLLVEDDVGVGESVTAALECFEFKVKHVVDGERCLRSVQEEEPALILLDLELPGMVGHEICRTLRARNYRRMPIIALSGCDDDEAIVRVLECGADDFVAKSQAIPVLLAHIRAVLNRGERLAPPQQARDTVESGAIRLDRTSSEVFVEGRSINLTPTEFRLLETFLSSPGAVFTRGQLIDRLHGVGYAVTPRTIDVHINGLRAHLGPHKAVLMTVRGVGYRLAERQPPNG